MLRVIASFLACLSAASARDMGKAFRTMPIVTNSLVNLGKMDIAFYFNARPQDLGMRSDSTRYVSNGFTSPKLDSVMTEPCPCSSLKYIRDSTQNHPADLLHRILSGNDLFSFKEPTSSTLCCDSHENVHEDILLEFGPRQSQIITNQQNSFPFLPYLLESMQSKPSSFLMPPKTKAVDILIFPKNGGPKGIDKLLNKKKDIGSKGNIQIVGDKEVRNDFKTYQFVPPLASSIKKDFNSPKLVEHVDNKKETVTTIDAKSNTV